MQKINHDPSIQWALIDAAGACSKVEQLTYVADHASELHSAGLYEIILLNAYLGKRWPDSPVSIVELFGQADPGKLRSMGDIIPLQEDTITLFRGVSGIGSRKRAGGLSWTQYIDVAAWHARLNAFPCPTVYAMTIPTRHIAVKIGPEIIVLPKRHGQIRLVHPSTWRPTLRNLEIEKSLELATRPKPGSENPEIIGARFTQEIKYFSGKALDGQMPMQGYIAEIGAGTIWNFLQRRYCGKKSTGATSRPKDINAKNRTST